MPRFFSRQMKQNWTWKEIKNEFAKNQIWAWSKTSKKAKKQNQNGLTASIDTYYNFEKRIYSVVFSNMILRIKSNFETSKNHFFAFLVEEIYWSSHMKIQLKVESKFKQPNITAHQLKVFNNKNQMHLLFRLSIRKSRNICARGGFFFQTNFDFLTSHFRRIFLNIIQKVLLSWA